MTYYEVSGGHVATPSTELPLLHAGPASASQPLDNLYSRDIAFVFCSPGESRNGDPGEGEGSQLITDVHDLQGLVYASGQ